MGAATVGQTIIPVTDLSTPLPAFSTAEIPAQATPEPNVPDTTGHDGMKHQECPRK